jgi:peptidyl-tRNA hydrolase, PTH1 family
VFLIVGLGNYDNEYENTRHNIGFEVVDKLSEKFSGKWIPGKGEYYYSMIKMEDIDIVLVKPVTYMNNSGIAVQQILQVFDIPLSNILIVCDDFNLPLGKIRLRPRGSDGGHNGLSSVIYHLITEEFPRLRIGIGNAFEKGEIVDFVLSKFSQEEIKIVNESVAKSVDSIICFIRDGINTAMNKFN